MKRWGFLLKLIPVLFLCGSAPLFASYRCYGAIPPNYTLALLFILSLTLYSETRIRSLGIISLFISSVALFSHIVYGNYYLPESSMYFIVLSFLFFFIGYFVIGRGLAKGTDDGTELPVLSKISFLSFIGLLSGSVYILMETINSRSEIAFFLSTIVVTASLLTLREIIRRNLDYDSQKIPFFYIFNKTIFKPVVFGFLGGLSIYSLFDHKLNTMPFFTIIFILGVITVFEYRQTKKRILKLPPHFCLDYFLIFFLSVFSGNGIIVIAFMFSDHYISAVDCIQKFVYLFSAMCMSYFAIILLFRKYKNLLSSSIKLSLCFPPVLLLILVLAEVLPVSIRMPIIICQANLKNLGTALEMYSEDNGNQYPKKLEQLSPKYLRKIKSCSGFEKNSFGSEYYNKVYGLSTEDYVYCTYEGNHKYTMYCFGNNHKDIGIEKNYPQYNSEKGLINNSSR